MESALRARYTLAELQTKRNELVDALVLLASGGQEVRVEVVGESAVTFKAGEEDRLERLINKFQAAIAGENGSIGRRPIHPVSLS